MSAVEMNSLGLMGPKGHSRKTRIETHIDESVPRSASCPKGHSRKTRIETQSLTGLALAKAKSQRPFQKNKD